MKAFEVYIGYEKWIYGGFKSRKNNWVRKKQIIKLPNLRKVRTPQSLTNFKSANLRICDLRNLFADHPPLILQMAVVRCLVLQIYPYAFLSCA
jgi:hypothetical protein